MLRLRKNGRAKRNILFKYARWSELKPPQTLSAKRDRGTSGSWRGKTAPREFRN